MSAEKAYEKIQYPFMTKTLNQIAIEINSLNTIKTIYEKLRAMFLCSNNKLFKKKN